MLILIQTVISLDQKKSVLGILLWYYLCVRYNYSIIAKYIQLSLCEARKVHVQL